MFCIKCGSENQDEAVFCIKCGLRLAENPNHPTESNPASTPPPEPLTQTMPAVEINPAEQPQQPPLEAQSSQGQTESFVPRLTNLGKAAMDETRRNAKLVSLKAQIEKAQRIDLANSYFELGRKCYELKCYNDIFEQEFAEISDLSASILKKRKGVSVADEAPLFDKLKIFGQNLVGKATAEKLAMKLKQLLTKLGEKASAQQSVHDLSDFLEAVIKIKTHIAEMKAEYATLSADHEAQKQFKNASVSLAKGADEEVHNLSKGIVGWFRRAINIKSAIAVGLLIVVLAIWGVSRITASPLEVVLAKKLETAFNANKQVMFNRIHPVGTATGVKVHEVSVEWKNGKPTNREKDVTQFTVRFTIYWHGPIIKDGYTKATQTYDEESNCWVGGQILSTNGVTNTEVRDGAIDFGIGFLRGYLEQRQQR